MRIERSICPFTMLVERSMLTMRLERSTCPLTMLVERSMLTTRIEKSICPLTRWMLTTIFVRRRLWSFWSIGLTRSITECTYMDQ